ncbi:hypothetical protein DP117_06970 [Brasilonema sp. UFV-L1]|uniref:hypothetical protein n=1 Tax=Brasilonema sp. UFV-L1 TaxID=2234130 RepID=UPI0016BD1BCD|nr:hypothetical protein [Brasilonema sp. UFV-L1]
MLYIALVFQLKPPPKEEKNQKTSHMDNSEFDFPSHHQVKTKTSEYIHTIQENYYLERRFFL